jgi:hypothetical protein
MLTLRLPLSRMRKKTRRNDYRPMTVIGTFNHSAVRFSVSAVWATGVKLTVSVLAATTSAAAIVAVTVEYVVVWFVPVVSATAAPVSPK